MGVELLEIGIKMKKCVIFTIKGCVRSVCNHPFLVCNLCFLIFLYRSFPFIFSLLVSASPVLICTAILLGTILSFGQPNIPEIEIEEKTTYESMSIKTGVSRDTIVVDQNENHYYVERYSDKKRDGAEQLSNKSSLSESKNGEICREGGSSNVEEEKSRQIESGDGEIWEDTIDEPKNDNEWNEERLLSDGEVVENHYSSILKTDEENNESDDVDSFNSEMVNVDSLNSPQSPWRHVENEDDEENEEDVVSDYGSDGVQSSSPDASMVDIMPMLDELHPLLDEDSSNPIQISLNASGLASERSSSRPSTSSSSRESVDEIENREDFEVEEDDDEADGQGDKEEGLKSVITWTEEDQKNLMDLGSSEIERNQRLENLILRRRKNVSMVPEINLIDLESSDFPPHVASISTLRQNPFDDSYDNNIPGSAPSILLQRRNPFEIPYESSQEKGNPMGDDGFQEQLPFFKRHESFNVGPSVFAPNRQDVKMRPYFVPERMISEESGFSPFHRQSSELSDSKASSIPETESVGSVEDLEDQKLPEEDNHQEPEVIIRTDEEVIEEGPSEDQEMITKKELSEEDVVSEPQLISEMNHVSEHIGHGSQSSSEDEEFLELGQVEKRDIESNDSCSKAFKPNHSRGSSYSSMSEIDNEESTQILVESGDLNNIMSTSADDVSHKEGPIYDSSPHAESNPSLPPVLVKRTVSFVERDSENRAIDKDITIDPEILSNVNVREHDDVKSISRVEDSEVEILVDDNKNLGRSEEEKRLMVDEGEKVASPNSDGDYQEANDRLMSTPSGGGSTSHFYDIAMHEPNFEHLEEVPVPNTPVESNEKMRTMQNLNIPEIYELDHDTSSSIGSPFSPDFISMPSSASSHVDMQTIHEEEDEIKEIDEGLSSDLDSVGDFSVTNEFEKRIIDSVGETSNMHETEHEIVEYEEDTKCKSEINEMDSQDFTVKETYEEGISFSGENEDTPTNSVLNHDYQVNDSLPKNNVLEVMPEVKARKVEDNDEVYKKLSDKEIGPTSEEETVFEENEGNLVNSVLNHDDQVNSSEKIELDMQSVDCLSKKAELTSVGQPYMVTTSGMPENTSTVDPTCEAPILDSRSIEEVTWDCDQIKDDSIETRKNPHSVEVEAEKVDLSVGEDSSVKKESSIAAEEKSYHEDLELTASIKGKGKKSESSSSSSSSSESDRE